MTRLLALRRDHYASALLIVLGGGASGLGLTYKFGSLNQMGAGFLPVVFGVLLTLTGLIIGITAAPQERADHNPHSSHLKSRKPEWRGWVCILGGVVAFVVFGAYGGLVPASFACVFIAALGDRQSSVKNAAILGAVVTAFGVGVFYYGLKLQLPLFQWGA